MEPRSITETELFTLEKYSEFINYLVTDHAAVSSVCAQISVAFMHPLQCSSFNFYFHVLICPVSVSVEESGSSDSA